MCRIHQLQHETTTCALASKSHVRVGAMIVKGNKIYARGCNNKRTSFLNMKDCSQHAEMAAAANFINNVVRRNPKKYCFVREKWKE